MPGDGETRGMPYRLAEGLLVADQVIRRHHHQYRRVAMFGLQRQGGDGNRRSGVAPGRFEDEMSPVPPQAGRLELVLALEVMLAVGHRDDFAMPGQEPGGTSVGLAQQGLAIGQAHERLRLSFTRHRPKAGTGAAGSTTGISMAYSRETRRRSASTIIRISSSRLVLGFQPSTRWALAGLPSSTSTSAGRKNAGSILRKSR